MRKPFDYQELEAVRRLRPTLKITERADTITVTTERLNGHFHILIWNSLLRITVMATGYESIHLDHANHDGLTDAVNRAVDILDDMERGTFRPNVDTWPKGYYSRWLEAQQ